MIDAKHLKLIEAIDKLGSLSKASKELNLTQSALSHQLKNLEDYLGVKIFHRTGSQLLFTDAGKELKEKAKSILADLQNLELRINEIKESQLKRYIHGYSREEAQRLVDQASTVAEFLHYDSIWPAGARILEVGCGVGAQTEIIAPLNPACQFLSIDISNKSLENAKEKIKEKEIGNVSFKLKDARDINPVQDDYFDHVFICFLLEHVSDPIEILQAVKKVIRPGGSLTVIEGDHGSTFFYPDNSFARKAIAAQVQLQARSGGNANIGRALYPLLSKAGFQQIEVSPRQIYVDSSKPALVAGFIKNTFTAMIEGVATEAIAAGLTTNQEMQKGIEALLRTAKEDGEVLKS